MKLFALTLLLLWRTVAASPAYNCGSTIGNFSEVDVTDCGNNNHECVLRKGTNATLNIIFTTGVAIESVTAVVHGIIQGIAVPFQLDPDACKTSLHCPLSVGPTYNYTAQLPVKKYYPSVQVTVKWELKNEAGIDIVCAEVPARIR